MPLGVRKSRRICRSIRFLVFITEETTTQRMVLLEYLKMTFRMPHLLAIGRLATPMQRKLFVIYEVFVSFDSRHLRAI